jgi:hypothetical protein
MPAPHLANLLNVAIPLCGRALKNVMTTTETTGMGVILNA